MKISKKAIVCAITFIVTAIAPIVNANELNENNIQVEEEISCFGTIHGGTYYLEGWGCYPLIFAQLELSGDEIYRTTNSGFDAHYIFTGLPLDKTYNIKCSANGYISQIETVTLTSTQPNSIVNFALEMDEVSYSGEIVQINMNEEQTCLGSIYGNTGESYIWGFSPVGLVKVEAGGKSTISSPIMGFYRIRNLPFGTYTVTGTKIGYDTRTETVKLSEEHPDQQCFIHMEPNDEDLCQSTQEEIATLEQTGNYGSIYGMVTTGGFPPLDPIPGAKLTLEGGILKRITFSEIIFGFYSFNLVPLGRTYTLTVTHPNYKTQIETITMTPENPHRNICFQMTLKEDVACENQQAALIGEQLLIN